MAKKSMSEAVQQTAGGTEPEELRTVAARVSEDAYTQTRMIAAENSKQIKELMVEALNLLFKKYGKPEIARAVVKTSR